MNVDRYGKHVTVSVAHNNRVIRTNEITTITHTVKYISVESLIYEVLYRIVHNILQRIIRERTHYTVPVSVRSIIIGVTGQFQQTFQNISIVVGLCAGYEVIPHTLDETTDPQLKKALEVLNATGATTSTGTEQATQPDDTASSTETTTDTAGTTEETADEQADTSSEEPTTEETATEESTTDEASQQSAE